MSTVITTLNVTPLIFPGTRSHIHGALRLTLFRRLKIYLNCPVGGFGCWGVFPPAPHKYMLLENTMSCSLLKVGSFTFG